MPILLPRPLLLVLAASLFACASQTPPPHPPGAPLAAAAPAKGYDARGQAKPCEPPPAECPAVSPDRELADRCSLGGFRMIQCGCEMLCGGNPGSGEKQAYDAEGHGKACAPAKDDCTPEPARAAFQDACSEKGHKLQVCGCEWLCSGNPAP
ncbi:MULTISPECIES: hypothetical protein [Polyangium]|uniref:Lipoprotein n=2 Tax=Polyangium TaxID=55 RepID=A0A4U1IZV9_9BACT|nr:MULTISPECIES: hypothetical protein [Polyangium]MDI1437302.1 hypothetical protein [Polyangium sorediatum]TKD00277.1 hypothetical protein E8A74_34790 [Polyangium fumosum]